MISHAGSIKVGMRGAGLIQPASRIKPIIGKVAGGVLRYICLFYEAN